MRNSLRVTAPKDHSAQPLPTPLPFSAADSIGPANTNQCSIPCRSGLRGASHSGAVPSQHGQPSLAPWWQRRGLHPHLRLQAARLRGCSRACIIEALHVRMPRDRTQQCGSTEMRRSHALAPSTPRLRPSSVRRGGRSLPPRRASSQAGVVPESDRSDLPGPPPGSSHSHPSGAAPPSHDPSSLERPHSHVGGRGQRCERRCSAPAHGRAARGRIT